MGSRPGVFELVVNGSKLRMDVASEAEKDEVEDRVEDADCCRGEVEVPRQVVRLILVPAGVRWSTDKATKGGRT